MVIEEYDLVFDRIRPIFPIMHTWTRNEVMWYVFIHKFLVEIAIYLIEEVTGTTINDKIQRIRLQEMCKIDCSILLPWELMPLFSLEL